jgi:predicted nucleic acid-binding protein
MTSKNSGSNVSGSIAFDTTAYSQLVRGNNEVAALLRETSQVVMPQPVIAELKSGFAFGSRQQENEAQLVRFLSSNKVLRAFPDEVTTEYYVALYSHARRHGRQLSHNDLWIAALSVQYGAKLITFDHDFDGLIDFKALRLQILDE